MKRGIAIALWTVVLGVMAWVLGASIFGVLAFAFSKPGQDPHIRELWDRVFYGLAFGLPVLTVAATIVAGLKRKLPGTD